MRIQRSSLDEVRQALRFLLASLWLHRLHHRDDRSLSLMLCRVMDRLALLILLLDWLAKKQHDGASQPMWQLAWTPSPPKRGSATPVCRALWCVPADERLQVPRGARVELKQSYVFRLAPPSGKRSADRLAYETQRLVTQEVKRSTHTHKKARRQNPRSLPAAGGNGFFLADGLYNGFASAWAGATASEVRALLVGNEPPEAAQSPTLLGSFANQLSAIRPGWAEGISWALQTVFGFGRFWADLVGGLLSFVFVAPLHLSEIVLAARVVDVAVHPLGARESRASVGEALVKGMVLSITDDAVTVTKETRIGPWRPSEYLKGATPQPERGLAPRQGISL
ncbi:hypothetical protein AB0C38_10070 [Amycolatopsis sp. NPDC048633]|uniref:hypothetical protein n=1 Tax=Amycolatopsis sp. NPDC048633 TaxID=3157095 RepID=UPI0033DB26B3